MPVSNEDLLKKIEELRQRMDALGRSVTSLRTDDVGRAFHEQIIASYLENNREGFRTAILGWEGEAPSAALLNDLSTLYDAAMEMYGLNDKDGAMKALDQLRALIAQLPEVGGAREIKVSLMGVVDRGRHQMAMMDTLYFHIGRPMLRRSCESAFGGIGPEELETFLAPLSNATRLRLLALLYVTSRSFTEMGRELGMQKGHLQFHLRRLTDAGYVKVDPRTHLYSIEGKGLLAVDGLGQLFSMFQRA